MSEIKLPEDRYPGGKPSLASLKNVGGRPLAITDQVIETIAAYVRHGCYLETAMAAVGLSRETFHDWSRKGRKDPESIYGHFVQIMDTAIAEAEIKDLLRISEASKKHWQAAAWKLERRHPNKWASRQELDVNTNQTIRFTTTIAEDSSIVREQEVVKDG